MADRSSALKSIGQAALVEAQTAAKFAEMMIADKESVDMNAYKESESEYTGSDVENENIQPKALSFALAEVDLTESDSLQAQEENVHDVDSGLQVLTILLLTLLIRLFSGRLCSKCSSFCSTS